MSKTAFLKKNTGTMTWDAWGRNCKTQQIIELICTYLESEISTFNHADIHRITLQKSYWEKLLDKPKLTVSI